MPATLVTPMSPLSPFTSALPNHVLANPHLTLHPLAQALAQERTTQASPRRDHRVQTRQRAHDHSHGRASTPARPVASHFLSRSPLTHLLTLTPASPWTSPLARQSTVAAVTDDDRPPQSASTR
jgi:hypothetical protein